MIPVKVKWAAPNTPVIKIDDKTLVLSKRELLELQGQIKEFLDYYHIDFLEPNVGWTDDE